MGIEVLTQIDAVPAEDWNRLGGTDQPCLRHEFLSALEDTGCAARSAGWVPHHVGVVDTHTGRLLGAAFEREQPLLAATAAGALPFFSRLPALDMLGLNDRFLARNPPPNLGQDYGDAFRAVYPRLAEQHGVALYPFFLEGVAGRAGLNQADGIHPNAQGVEVMVQGILDHVIQLIHP